MRYQDGLAALKADNDHAPKSLASRFLAKVETSNDNDCWIWTGAKSGGNGYGTIRDGKRTDYAHRVAHELFKGPIPEGKMVLHTCDCRECANPKHVYAGTHKQNVEDAVERERYTRRGKLRPAQVLEIVAAVRKGKTHVAMSAKFHISVEAIARIMQGKSWSKLTGIKPTAPKITAKQGTHSNRKTAKIKAHN